MDLINVRHLREVLIADERGKLISTMQYSSQNTYHFRPSFVEVPAPDQAAAHELYIKWGGQRREGVMFGMTVTIPLAARAGNRGIAR
jgi:hypothetical protein